MYSVIFVFGAVMLFCDGIVWICGFRALSRQEKWRVHRWLFTVFMLFQAATFAGLLWAASSGKHVDRIFPTPLVISLYLWHLLLMPGALVWSLLTLVFEALAVARRLATRGRQNSRLPEVAQPVAEISEPAPVELDAPASLPVTRREFIGATAALTPPLLSLALSAVAAEQLQSFRVRRVDLPVHGLPGELDGVTIAQVSDTHVGRFTHGKVMQKVADATNALRADLVVFTGDLINDSLDWLPSSIEMLKKIDGPLVMCEGNHDLIEGAHLFRAGVRAAGLNLLVNSVTTLKVRGCPVQFLGLPWAGPERGANNEDMLARYSAMLTRLRDHSAFPIVMAHHPHAWDHFPDMPLVLSGHTHGGQLMLNERLGAGPILFRYWTGLYTRNGRTLFISNGVGNWFPLRTAAPAEIVHLTLRRAV